MITKEFFKFFDCIKVSQFHHQNQYEILVKYEDKKYVIFQSYDTVIAIYCYEDDELYLSRYNWDYSRTTLRHLYLFINTHTMMFCHSLNDIMNLLREGHIQFYN